MFPHRDGRALLRELVQNADDAVAKRLLFVVLDRGWPQARNSLLRGPALMVANDGPFPDKGSRQSAACAALSLPVGSLTASTNRLSSYERARSVSLG